MSPAPRPDEEIAAAVRHGWTGNRQKDLMGFAASEFAEADRVWHEEAASRYAEAEAKRGRAR